MAAMASPHIPQELVDLITEKASYSTLLECLRVNRSWSSASRRLVFERVSLDERNYVGFLELLEGGDFTPYVRSIDLRNQLRMMQGDHMVFTARPEGVPINTVWLPRTLPEVVQRFPYITSLGLDQISWNDVDTENRELLLKGWKQVKSLSLDQFHFPSSNEALQLIHSFPLLEKLDWVRLSMQATHTSILTSLDVELPLSSITLDASTATDPALLYLASHSTAPSIELKIIHPFTDALGSYTHLNSFLAIIGPKVTKLSFSVWHFETDNEMLPRLDNGAPFIPINLSTFSNLQHLVLSALPPDPWDFGDRAHAQPHQLIRTIPSTTLIKMKLSATVLEDPNLYSWDLIDIVLKNSPFAGSLQEVAVVLSPVYDFEDHHNKLSEEVRSKMIWARSKEGVLKVMVQNQ